MNITKHDVFEAVASQRARTVALAQTLTPEEWETDALPGWRVREVIGHLVASDEGAITMRLFTIGVRPQQDGGIQAVERWNETQVRRWSERPVADLITGLEKWGRRSVGLFNALPQAFLSRRVPLPFGKVPLLFLGEIRLLDEWVHEQDIRRAIKRPDLNRDATHAAARAMLDVAATQTPSRIPAGASGSVALRIDAPGFPAARIDFATKSFTILERIGASDEGADATITTDPASILMVGANRDAWRDAEQSGAIKIEGSRSAGELFLDALRAG